MSTYPVIAAPPPETSNPSHWSHPMTLLAMSARLDASPTHAPIPLRHPAPDVGPMRAPGNVGGTLFIVGISVALALWVLVVVVGGAS